MNARFFLNFFSFFEEAGVSGLFVGVECGAGDVKSKKSNNNNMEGTRPNAYNYGGHPAP